MNISLVDSDLAFLSQLTGLAPKWKEVGDHLGVPADELDAIQQNNHGSVDMVQNCLRDMFKLWLRNGKAEARTVEKLTMAVRAVGRLDIEIQIKKKYGKWNIDIILLHSQLVNLYIIFTIFKQVPLRPEF